MTFAVAVMGKHDIPLDILYLATALDIRSKSHHPHVRALACLTSPPRAHLCMPNITPTCSCNACACPSQRGTRTRSLQVFAIPAHASHRGDRALIAEGPERIAARRPSDCTDRSANSFGSFGAAVYAAVLDNRGRPLTKHSCESDLGELYLKSVTSLGTRSSLGGMATAPAAPTTVLFACVANSGE